jgi:hypothetical protein
METFVLYFLKFFVFVLKLKERRTECPKEGRNREEGGGGWTFRQNVDFLHPKVVKSSGTERLLRRTLINKV